MGERKTCINGITIINCGAYECIHEDLELQVLGESDAGDRTSLQHTSSHAVRRSIPGVNLRTDHA